MKRKPFDEIERRHMLAALQRRMQSIWNQYEAAYDAWQLTGNALRLRGAENHMAAFEKLEVQERELLRPGLPLTERAARA